MTGLIFRSHYLDVDFIENLISNSFSQDAIDGKEPFKNPKYIVRQFKMIFLWKIIYFDKENAYLKVKYY